MVSEKLVLYVKDNLRNGLTKESITQKLRGAGVSQKSIQDAFKKAGDVKPAVQPQASGGGSTAAIIQYIQTALSKHITPEAIRDRMIKAGWNGKEVESAIATVLKRKELEPVERPQLTEEELRRRKDIAIKEEYHFHYMDIDVKVIIYAEKGKPTRFYHMVIPGISSTTDLILEEIRLKLIDQINLGTLEIAGGDFRKLDQHVQGQLVRLVGESFPHVDSKTQQFLVSYLISKVLGIGIVEIVKADDSLEEIVINNSDEPVYIYHKKHGWCKTNQYLKDQEEIMHIASMTGRKIGREISTLVPLLDAHLPTGDRVNATLKPITADSPTITIRKFSNDPWTITKFLQTKTMDFHTAAIIWMAIHFEMSALVVGGTASGKTSCLNVLTNLIPPDQRIISIEDTREIRLPSYMHWVPMSSRQPNAEGKGGVQMEDLLVNSLRMRPDRIIVGEVRKREQAETLFEAIHTGHSVYATFHANDSEETIVRLTNPPVDIPKTMMPAISLLIVQFRNRRSGLRRTFQIAEITKTGDANVLYQYDAKADTQKPTGQSQTFFRTLQLFTGSSMDELNKMMNDKIKVLKYLVKHNLTSIEQVGKVMAMYYTEQEFLFKNFILPNRRIK